MKIKNSNKTLLANFLEIDFVKNSIKYFVESGFRLRFVSNEKFADKTISDEVEFINLGKI